MKVLKNKKGFVTIAIVVMVSGTILTSLTLTYIYSMNRLRYQARIKEAYKLMNATESAAKVVKNIYDQQHALNAATAGWRSDDAEAAVIAAVAALPKTTCPASSIEIENSEGGPPYCFNYNAGEVFNGAQIKTPNTEKFLAKLIYFFDGQKPTIKLEKPTLVGWLINEKKAMAATVSFVGAAPACPGNPGCALCVDGIGNASKSACSVLTVCPSIWAECQAGGAGVTQAIRISNGALVAPASVDDY